jgi:hypothetical protein
LKLNILWFNFILINRKPDPNQKENFDQADGSAGGSIEIVAVSLQNINTLLQDTNSL